MKRFFLRKEHKGYAIVFKDCGHVFDVYRGAKKQAVQFTERLERIGRWNCFGGFMEKPVQCNQGTCFGKFKTEAQQKTEKRIKDNFWSNQWTDPNAKTVGHVSDVLKKITR